jgi:hypothetical protein
VSCGIDCGHKLGILRSSSEKLENHRRLPHRCKSEATLQIASRRCNATKIRVGSDLLAAGSGLKGLIAVRKTGRNERIRTSDPFVPNEVRYQAALHSDIPEQADTSRLTIQQLGRQLYQTVGMGALGQLLCSHNRPLRLPGGGLA